MDFKEYSWSNPLIFLGAGMKDTVCLKDKDSYTNRTNIQPVLTQECWTSIYYPALFPPKSKVITTNTLRTNVLKKNRYHQRR